MKKRLLLPLLSLICALFMVACNGGKKDGNIIPGQGGGSASALNTAYLNVLPGNAYAIMKLDFGNLLDKSQILSSPIVKVGFNQFVNDAPEEIATLLKSIYENPSKSGIDLSAPVYAALVKVEPVAAVMTIPVKNINDFEALLHTIVPSGLIQENGGMKYINLGLDNVKVAYDADKLVIAYHQYYADVWSYTNMAAEAMAVNAKKFSSFFKGDDDAKIVFNVETIINKLFNEGLVEPGLKLPLAIISS